MYKNTDQKCIKFSKRRLVICKNIIESYVYEKAFSYNWAPMRNDSGGGRKKNSPRARRSDNLFKTQRMLQRLISSNLEAYGERPKFVTYTFADNIKNVEEANERWSLHMRILKRRFGGLKYLCVIEFQKRGAVHYHVLFFNMPYTRGLKKILADTWGQGFIKIITLSRVNNVGAYVAKYLQEDTHDIRLSGKKAYFCSRGLYKPIEMRNEQGINEWTEENCFDSMEMVGEPKSYNSDRYGTIHYLKKQKKKIFNHE